MTDFLYYTAQQLPKQEPRVYNEAWTDITPELETILGTHFVSNDIAYKDQFVDGLSAKGGATDPPTFAAFSGGVGANRFDNGATMAAAFPATTTVTQVQAGSGVINQHQYLTVAVISGVGLVHGAVMAFRIYREGNHAADTFTGNAFLHRIALHYQVNRLGSAS